MVNPLAYKLHTPNKNGANNMLPQKADVAHENWWDLISGHEKAFSSLETLFHAISDDKAKIEAVRVNADNKTCLQIKWVDPATTKAGRTLKFARFEIASDLKDAGHHPQGRYVTDVVRIANKKNRSMGRVLTAVWTSHLKEQRELQKIATTA